MGGKPPKKECDYGKRKFDKAVRSNRRDHHAWSRWCGDNDSALGCKFYVSFCYILKRESWFLTGILFYFGCGVAYGASPIRTIPLLSPFVFRLFLTGF